MSAPTSSSSLPPGWARASLGDIGVWRGGGTPTKSDNHLWRDGVIPWVSPKDMKVGVIEDAQDRLTDAARERSSFKTTPAGSVLVVTRSGILQHTLPVAVTAREVAFNQDLKALTPHPGVDPRYVALYLRAEADHVLDATVKAGTTVQSIDAARLLAFPIKLAPSAEQRRIVAKLEPLLARCALIKSELDRVAILVARQRRGALIAAFRGDLNKAPRDASGRPIDWEITPLSSLIDEGPSNGLSPSSASGGVGTLSLRLTATTSGVMRLDDNAVKRVAGTVPPDSRFWLRPGDLLVQRANAREHVGAAAIFDGPAQTYIYPDLMMRIRIGDDLMRRYVWMYLNSPTARAYFQERATGSASTMPKITGPILRALPLPLPPRDQMTTILELLDSLSHRLDAVVAENQRCMRLVEKLEKALLRKAFAGRLVEQLPGEMSAQDLINGWETAPASPGTEGQSGMAKAKGPRGDDPRNYLERRLEVWPAEGVAFEQLRDEAPGSYEELKDLVFNLLEHKRLAQRYDARERRMKLVRT